MKSGQVAAAVGIGYLLGRTKKMRLAIMIAAGTAIGKLGGGPPQLLRQGYQRIADVPEVSNLTESVRGDLFGAAKSAVVTAATSRIESLNSRLRNTSSTDGDEPEDETEDERDDDYDQDQDQDEEEQPKPIRRRSSSSAGRNRTRTPPVRRSRRSSGD